MRSSPPTFLLLCALATSGVATANPRVILTAQVDAPGNAVPGVPGRKLKAGTATFSRPQVSPSGRRWVLRAVTDTGATATDEVVLAGLGFNPRAFRVVVTEGMQNPADVSTNLATFAEFMGIDDAGNVAFRTSSTAPSTSDQFVMRWNGTTLTPVAREGDAFPAGAGLQAGSNFGSTFDAVGLLADGRVHFRNAGFAGVSPPGTSTTGSGLFLATDQTNFAPAVAVGSSSTTGTLITVTTPGGQLVAPAQAVATFATDRYFVSADGSTTLYFADLAGATATDFVAVVNDTVVAQEGVALPNAPGLGLVGGFNTTAGAWGVSRAGGHWGLRGFIGGTSASTTTDDFVLLDGQVVAKTGDPIVPGSPVVWDDTASAATWFSSSIGPDGNYLLGGFTVDTTPGAVADATQDVYLVRGGPGGAAIVAREGMTVDLDGDGAPEANTRLHIFNDNDMFLTPDGDAVFEAEVRFADGTGAFPTTGQQMVLGVLAPRTVAVESPPGTTLTHDDPAAGARAFGNVPVGDVSAATSFTFRNTGTRSVVLGEVSLAGANPGAFRLTGLPLLPAVVAAGGTVSFAVAFAPPDLAPYTATIEVHHDGGNVPWPFKVQVSGTGVERPAPLLQVRANGGGVAPDEGASGPRAFGDLRVGTTSTPVTVSLLNTGTAACAIGTISLIGPDAADFVLADLPTLPGGLGAARSLEFTVAFRPTATGARLGSVRLTHTCANVPSPFDFGVSGTGRAPELVLLDAAADLPESGAAVGAGRTFPDTRTGAGTTLDFVLGNDGTLPLSIDALAFAPSDGPFTVAAPAALPTSIAAGGDLTLTVAFRPTERGTFDGALLIEHDDPRRPDPFVVNVRGRGVAPVLQATSAGAPLASGDAIPLGDVFLGESSEAGSVLIENTGEVALSVTRVDVGGDLGAFLLHGFPATGAAETVAPGSGRLYEVTFTPTATGPRALDVTFTTDAGPFVVHFTGTGIAPPALEVHDDFDAPIAHDADAAGDRAFGAVTVGDTKDAIVRLRNAGSGVVHVTNVTFDGDPGFSLLGQTTLELTGASVRVAFRFAPTSVGAASTVARIEHDASNLPSPFRLHLTAYGQPCTAGSSPESCAGDDGPRCVEGSPENFCGCTADADCGDAVSGRVCDFDGTRRCIEGCSIEVGDIARNGCPAGLFCTSRTPGAVGSCSVTCTSETDCAERDPARPHCGVGLTTPLPDLCVACRDDADCADPTPVCATDTFTCGECSSSETAACDADGKGARCLSTNACGCTSDGDCAANRTCDTSQSVCVARPDAPDAGGAVDGGQTPEPPAGGCGCNGGPLGAFAALGPVLAWIRRRRR